MIPPCAAPDHREAPGDDREAEDHGHSRISASECTADAVRAAHALTGTVEHPRAPHLTWQLDTSLTSRLEGWESGAPPGNSSSPLGPASNLFPFSQEGGTP